MQDNTRTPHLEVVPNRIEAEEFVVRIRSVNGNTLMTSKPYTQGNALRFARALNTSVAQGRLVIRVLNERSQITRIIHPGESLVDAGELVL